MRDFLTGLNPLHHPNTQFNKIRRIKLILSYLEKILIRGDLLLDDILPIYNRCLDRCQREKIIEFLNSFNLSREAISCKPKCSIDYMHNTTVLNNSLEAKLMINYFSDLSNYDAYSRLSTNTMSDYEYYQHHLVDVHDIWHILIDADTTLAGEMKVWSFLYGQIPTDYGAFFSILKIFLFGVFYSKDKDSLMELAISFSQGLRIGREAHLIFGVDWNQYRSQSLPEIRKEFGINC